MTSERSAVTVASMPTTNLLADSLFDGAETPSEPKLRHLRLEIVVFLLLVGTFAAVLLRSSIVDRHLHIDPAIVSQFPVYSYDDKTSNGNSTVAIAPDRFLKWSCEINGGYAHPFCGYGFSLDKSNTGEGVDMLDYGRITLTLRYQGPTETIRLNFKQQDVRNGKPVPIEDVMPVAIAFNPMQGLQTIQLNMADVAVEQWWLDERKLARPDAGEIRLDNVIAVDFVTGSGAKLGHHEFEIEAIDFDGSVLSTEQWYLLLLAFWTGLTALLLVRRLVSLKRNMALRQQRHRAEAAVLEAAWAEAESASRAKSRFLANMTHELRTPLNAILGFAQILRSADLDERHVRAARTIQESGEHLLGLITDILDLSKIEAGKLEIANAPFDVKAMVRIVADMIHVRADEKDLHFAWTVAPDVPQRVVGDEKHLRQVLINLLGNAVKFTEHGQVLFDVGVVAREGGNVFIRFEVRDTGRGIAEDKLHLVFQPFEQAGTAGTRAGGTGLGLSISQHLLEQMGSRIELESRLGEGSRFWFDLCLPLAGCKMIAASGEAEADIPAPARAGNGTAMAVPGPDRLRAFLTPALAGNMRAIRVEAEALRAESPEYRAFAERIIELARGFQSAAVLDLVERNLSEGVEA